MKRDLNRLIRTKHKLNEVTQVESTTYQSRNDTFLGQVGEQVLGNVATRVLFPNRQDVSTFEADYTSNIAITSFYGNLDTRLNSAPYSRGGDGWILLNGNASAHTLSAQQMGDHRNEFLRAGRLDYRGFVVSKSGSLNNESVGLVHYGLSADALDLNTVEESDELTAFYSPYIGISNVGRILQYDVSMGLSYRTGTGLDNALGWRYGFGLTFYPIRPLALNLIIPVKTSPTSLMSVPSGPWIQHPWDSPFTFNNSLSAPVIVGILLLKAN